MNEQTTQLIESLAQKLGTTTEYLWSVLIKQAPLSAMTDLIYLVIIIISGIILYKVHVHFSKENDHGISIYYESEELVVIPMVIFSVAWIILFIICFLSLPNIINGFINPEYWALNKLIN